MRLGYCTVLPSTFFHGTCAVKENDYKDKRNEDDNNKHKKHGAL